VRRPTPTEKLYLWHKQALAGWSPDVHEDEPQCGWYRTKLHKHGVWVPAAIWIEREIDERTGELLGDETLKGSVYRKPRDAYDLWSWVCQEPVTEGWYWNRLAELDWAREHAPDSPDGRPDLAVDWLMAPLPSFKTETEQDD
jgi:hypothetical protein